jgi:TolA-binding protein
MNFNLQDLFNTIGGACIAFGIWMHNRQTGIEKRVQSLEDIHTIKIDQVAEKLDKLEKKFEELSYNIHKEKNQEQKLTSTLDAILRELKHKNTDTL